MQACLQVAKGAREGGYHPKVAVIYDELVRKELAEQSQKNDPAFKPDSDTLGRIDKHMLERALRLDRERSFGHGKSSGKGKNNEKGAGKGFGKSKDAQGYQKGHGKYDNGNNHQDNWNRGEKRTLPWKKEHGDHKKRKQAGSHIR